MPRSPSPTHRVNLKFSFSLSYSQENRSVEELLKTQLKASYMIHHLDSTLIQRFKHPCNFFLPSLVHFIPHTLKLTFILFYVYYRKVIPLTTKCAALRIIFKNPKPNYTKNPKKQQTNKKTHHGTCRFF